MGVEATSGGKKGVCKMAEVKRLLHLAKCNRLGMVQSQPFA